LIVGFSGGGTFNKIILVIAIAFGTINVVGGFLVTDRMLEMFKSRPKPATNDGAQDAPEGKAGGS
jgi:NAD(P) transhydrogenase subunit alpha